MPNTQLQQLTERDIHNDRPLHCVLVDEAQFLCRAQVWQPSEVVDCLHIPVLCYGPRTAWSASSGWRSTVTTSSACTRRTLLAI